MKLNGSAIESGETVRLDGSGSSDAKGGIDLYEWDIDGRPGYEIAIGDPVGRARLPSSHCTAQARRAADSPSPD